MTGESEARVTQADIARALKHLGFDSVEDLHYWAMDNNELTRFDALCQQLAEHREASTAPLLDAIEAARKQIAKLLAELQQTWGEEEGYDPDALDIQERLTALLAKYGRG
jgi:hypothetical protein